LLLVKAVTSLVVSALVEVAASEGTKIAIHATMILTISEAVITPDKK
jgi:hypothetical protein